MTFGGFWGSRRVAHRYCISDAALADAVARDGYVVLDLLSPAEVDALREARLHHGVAPGDPEQGLFNDTWSTDLDYKRAIGTELSALMAKPVERTLPGLRPLSFVYIVKWPGLDGAVVAHRDPTFVDESRFRSVMLWCALDELDDARGALWVVPRSHRRSAGVRAHQSQENLHPEVDQRFRRMATPVELHAGQAILYDHALIHRSGPNTTGVPRTVVSGVLVPDAAEPLYAVPLEDGSRATIRIDERFFIDHRLCELDVDRVLREYPTIASPRD